MLRHFTFPECCSWLSILILQCKSEIVFFVGWILSPLDTHIVMGRTGVSGVTMCKAGLITSLLYCECVFEGTHVFQACS